MIDNNLTTQPFVKFIVEKYCVRKITKLFY